jgi:hypothetical protein
VIGRCGSIPKGASTNKLEISSLTKQLQLMFNLYSHYISEIPMEYWEKLFDALQSQETTLRNIIMNEEGPLKKKMQKMH